MSAYDYYDAQTGEGLTEGELHERYDDWLDELYPELTIAGTPFDTSRALQELDPIAYRCGFNDWLDSELGETLTETEPSNLHIQFVSEDDYNLDSSPHREDDATEVRVWDGEDLGK